MREMVHDPVEWKSPIPTGGILLIIIFKGKIQLRMVEQSKIYPKEIVMARL